MSPAKSIARAALAPALIALILGTGFVVVRLARNDWDPSRFVVAGDKYGDPATVPHELHIQRHATGYDGQFFYRLALDPFSHRKTEHGITFDASPTRHQRILYPLIVWTLARAHIASVPWLLIGVNVVAYAGLGFVGGLLAQHVGRKALWGLAVPLYPGFIVTMALDLAEIVAALLLLTGLMLLWRRRFGWATVAFTAAALSRETTLIVPIGMLAAWLFHRWRRRDLSDDDRPPGSVFAVPIAVTVVWQLLLWAAWGTHPLFAAGRQFGFPFVSAAQQVGRWIQGRSAEDLFQLMEFALLVTLVAAGGRAALRARNAKVLSGPWLVAALLITGLPAEIWRSQTNFLRAGAEASLLSIVLLLDRERADLRPLLLAAGLFTAANMAVWTGVGRFG